MIKQGNVVKFMFGEAEKQREMLVEIKRVKELSAFYDIRGRRLTKGYAHAYRNKNMQHTFLVPKKEIVVVAESLGELL